MKAENLRPLVTALAHQLVVCRTDNRHLLYPTYTALEKFNSLLGLHRFYSYLHWDKSPLNQTAVAIYENLQKRAPSPQIFVDVPCAQRGQVLLNDDGKLYMANEHMQTSLTVESPLSLFECSLEYLLGTFHSDFIFVNQCSVVNGAFMW